MGDMRACRAGLHLAQPWSVCRPFMECLGLSSLVLLAASAIGQNPPPAPNIPASPVPSANATQTSNIVIRGTVHSGNIPIPGATVTASNAATHTKFVGWTDLNGQYTIAVPSPGHYTVVVEMPAFAPSTREVTTNSTGAEADVVMQLASRVQQAASTQFAAGSQSRQGMAAGKRGFQSLALMQQALGGDSGGSTGNDVVPSGMPIPGVDSRSATESIAVSGNQSPSMFGMSTAEIQQRFQEAREQQDGYRGSPFGGPPGTPAGSTQAGAAGVRSNGSLGFSRSGPGGGPPGGGGMMVFGGRGRFDINRPHGTVYYSANDSSFDAAPYSLTGTPATKAPYLQQSFGAAIGGPFNIPKLFHGGTKTFFFSNYNGARGNTPYDAYSTVPTLLERSGNFSQTLVRNGTGAGQPVQIFDPATHLPFTGNKIPQAQINSAAAGLLKYIPLPNLPGNTQNFHFITSAGSSRDDLNLRFMHALGNSSVGPRRGGPRNNLTFGFHYHSTNTDLTDPYPTIGGATSVRSFDVPLGYIRSFGKLTNIFRVDYNRNRIATQNLYAFARNITGDLGITGVSSKPFDWGLPNLSFTNFGSVQDNNPMLRRDQTWTFSDFMIWNHGKHTWRFGGDFRPIQINNETDSNARGSFIFTGLNTSNVVNRSQVAGTGYDFADFLLGLPQQTSVQYGYNNYHFRGNSWDLFAQDDWKIRGNLTLNLGLRYEYVSPFSEIDNRIVNLDFAPGFTAVVPVLPGQTGPFNGTFPVGLVRPDRNNFAPRVGIAWRALSKTVLRAGYGVNYNTTAYSSMVQQLAFQPPFSITQTNIQSESIPLTLQAGFPAVPPGAVTNNYGVDPNYRLGYVHIWNADVQQELSPTLILNLDYTGTKGTHLDVIEAPNRTATGLRIPGVQPFLWETSGADSTAHAGSVRLRKRLQHGVSIGGTYTFSKSIDDASTIGGAAVTSQVAQNAFDIAAERGLSSFDQRHRFTADYLVELPFGHDEYWLSNPGILRDIFGDWQWSGDWTIASGYPFTPRILGNVADVNRGTNGTLRPDVTGQSISLADPSIAQWFNTAAFIEPAFGQYGNARRNSIEGPGSRLFDMAFTKVFPLRESKMLEFRAQLSNVFNTPQYASIDTVVNSPTYGRVVAVSAMRTMLLTARLRF